MFACRFNFNVWHFFKEAEEILELMIKKFSQIDLETWYLYDEHLLKTQQHQKSKDLLQRALKSMDKKHRNLFCSKFILYTSLNI